MREEEIEKLFLKAKQFFTLLSLKKIIHIGSVVAAIFLAVFALPYFLGLRFFPDILPIKLILSAIGFLCMLIFFVSCIEIIMCSYCFIFRSTVLDDVKDEKNEFFWEKYQKTHTLFILSFFCIFVAESVSLYYFANSIKIILLEGMPLFFVVASFLLSRKLKNPSYLFIRKRDCFFLFLLFYFLMLVSSLYLSLLASQELQKSFLIVPFIQFWLFFSSMMIGRWKKISMQSFILASFILWFMFFALGIFGGIGEKIMLRLGVREENVKILLHKDICWKTMQNVCKNAASFNGNCVFHHVTIPSTIGQTELVYLPAKQFQILTNCQFTDDIKNPEFIRLKISKSPNPQIFETQIIEHKK